MAQVLLTKSKLDLLAQTVVNKVSGTTLPLTIDQIITIISNLKTTFTVQNKTVTPTTSSQSITPDTGYDGLNTVTINAIPANYIDTSTATAAATDIRSGETAYVDGNLITGNVVFQTYYTGSSVPTSSLGNNGDLYFLEES